MSSETPDSNDREGARSDTAEPTTAELQKPSTEKAPGEELTSAESDVDAEADAGAQASDGPSHEAVGIGVIGAPLVDPEQVDATGD